MSIFLTILFKLIPLYFLIALGLASARILRVEKEKIAKLLIYIITPAVIFYGAYTAELNAENLSLPLLMFLLCTFIAVLFYAVGRIFYQNEMTKNLLSYTAGTGNTGYFGLPVIISLFGENALSLAVLLSLGHIVYENSIGFYITAKGNHDTPQSLRRVVRLPTVYAFTLGLLLNYFNFDVGQFITPLFGHFRGAYTLLGMMIIGMGLAQIRLHHIDVKFILLAFVAKFLVWPGVTLLVISIDSHSIQFLNPELHPALMVISLVPLAANTVALASELRVHPEKAALAVLLSTLAVLFVIPFAASRNFFL